MTTKILANKLWISYSILIFGICLTIATAIYTKKELEAQSMRDFALVGNEIKSKITTRLHSHAQLLRSGASFFASSDDVSRNDWKAFVESSRLNKNMPGIQGVGFSSIVKKEELQKHIQKIRHEGFPDYKVKPKGDREIYTSIIYLEPFTGRNLRAFGYDMYSEPIRRKAMDQACDYDIAALSGKVVLVQETEKDLQPGTLMYVPVYKKGLPTNTIKERRAAIEGWVYSPYRMIDLMQGILDKRDLNDKNKIHLQIYDNESISQNSILFDSQSKDSLTNNETKIQTLILPIIFNDKKWTLQFSHLNSQFPNFPIEVFLVIITGFIITLLLFFLSLSLINTRSKARQIAIKLTSEIKENEANFKLLFNFNPDIVNIVRVIDNQIVEVNNNFINQFGFTLDEIIGRTTTELNIWTNPSNRELLFNEIIEKNFTKNFEAEFRCKDGSKFTGLISTKLVDFKGKPHILCITRDISERKQIENDLKESETNFRNLANSGNILVWKSGTDKLCTYFNDVWLEFTGRTLEQELGNGWAEGVHPDDFQNCLDIYNSAFDNHEKFSMDYRLKNNGGEYRWIVDDGCPVYNSKNEFIGYVGHCYDITDRKQLDEILKDERQRLTSIIKGTNVATWEWNVQTGETIFNERWAEIIGYTIKEISPISIETWMKFSHPDDLKISGELLEKHFRGELDFYEFETRMKHKDGSWIWVLDSGKVTSWSQDGKPLMMMGSHLDITERKRTEQELKDSKEQLSNFASHLQNVREKERQFITLEIHDSLAQFLVALKMDMGMFKKKVTNGNKVIDSQAVVFEMDQLIAQVDNANKSARRIMNGLRPEQLELLGFVEAAEVHLRDFEETHHISSRFESTILEPNIHSEQSLTLFRILQESLNNIFKHAMATMVTVKLTNPTGKLVMEIDDNGIGFDKNQKVRSDSYGLIGMKERVKLLDGIFNISTVEGKGTTVRVEMPYEVKVKLQ